MEKDKRFVVSKVTTKRPDLNELDNNQRAAVDSIMEDEIKNVVIRANPGSGKTFTLTSAIANYRYEYINDSIVAITFTRAAKAEMEDRLHSMGVYDVEVATIHAWAKTRLEKFAAKYGFELKIIQEDEIKRILKDIVVPHYLKSHRAIRNVNIDILYSFISGMKNMDVTDNYKRTLMALEERYQGFKKEMGLYDFGDYPRYLLEVMKQYNEFIYDIDALFVDEFQDVDPDQFEVFTRVDTKRKFYIGDEKQAIYEFRGACGEVFSKLKDFQTYTLEYNYRSYQIIIDLATQFYRTARGAVDEGYDGESILSLMPYERENSPVTCSRGEGGVVYTIQTGHFGNINATEFRGENVTTVDANIAFKQFRGFTPMVLCRTNKQVRALKEFGLNCTTVHQAKGLEYDNVILVDFEIRGAEDVNVAYVGLTRAKDRLMIIDFMTMLELLKKGYNKSLI